MRQVRRPNAVPPTLDAGGAGHAAHHHNVGAVEKRFPQHWRNPDVLGTLYAMQGWVCAYCGVSLGPNDAGDVEHFRPKAHYWWVAYAFANYLLACRICNSSRKGSRFPLLDGAERAGGPQSDLAAERRVLFDPTVDPVEDHVGVDLDRSCRWIGRAEPDRVLAVIRFFDLDRPDLLRERLRVLDDALGVLYRDPMDVEPVQRLAARYRAHSAVATELLVRSGRPPPSVAEEVRWHAEDLVQRLDLALDAVETEPDTSLHGKRRDDVREVLWALGVLLRDPAGDPDEVRAVLRVHGRL